MFLTVKDFGLRTQGGWRKEIKWQKERLRKTGFDMQIIGKLILENGGLSNPIGKKRIKNELK